MAVALVVVGIIVLKVVPEFAAFYDSFGAELPLVTRVIVKTATFVRSQILLLTGAAFAFAITAGVTLGALAAQRWGVREGDLVALEDERHAIPPYDAVVLVSAGLTARAPDAVEALRGRIPGRGGRDVSPDQARTLLNAVLARAPMRDSSDGAGGAPSSAILIRMPPA